MCIQQEGGAAHQARLVEEALAAEAEAEAAVAAEAAVESQVGAADENSRQGYQKQG